MTEIDARRLLSTFQAKVCNCCDRPTVLVASCARCGEKLDSCEAGPGAASLLRSELKVKGLWWEGLPVCSPCQVSSFSCEWRGSHNHPSITCYRRHRCRCVDCRAVNATLAAAERERGVR